MTDMVNNDIEHANNTNPCQGVCVVDGDFCIACFRTSKERSDQNEPARTDHRKQVCCSTCRTTWATKFYKRVNRSTWIYKSCGCNECDT